MSWLREVTVENPMFAELRRPWQRMASGGPSAPHYRVGVLAVIVGFFSVAALFARGNTGFEPVAAIQMAALAFLVPPMMYKTIAGERDKRSWDILISAPVTPGQIVVGRFALGAMAVAGVCALGLLIAPFTWPQDYNPYITEDYEVTRRAPLVALLSSQLYLFGFGLVLVAIAVFVSARSRKGFTALASTYSLFFAWLVLFPTLLSFLTMDARYLGPLLEPLIPWQAVVSLAATYRYGQYDAYPESNSLFLNLVLPNVAYLFLTVGLLVWASRTLHFPDNEIRFLARKHRA